MGRAAAALAVLLGLAGCQGPGVPTDAIPGDPIAILYREPDQARRRAEQLLEQQGLLEREEGPPEIDKIFGYVADLFGRPGVDQREFEGRLALLDPRSGEVDVIEHALRGAVPQDWSADHRRLLFAQQADQDIQLMEFDLDRRRVRPLTHGPAAHPRGCYGPGGRLVYAEVDPRRRTVHLLMTDPGGTNPERISQGNVAHSPACADDGSALAYVAVRAGGAEQIVTHLPALGGTPRAIAPGRYPSFSPDGEWIAYSARVKGEWKLWRIRPDGSGRAPIGRGAFLEEKPAISPDGALVAYVTEAGMRPWLYLRRLDGTGDRILFSDGDADFPVW